METPSGKGGEARDIDTPAGGKGKKLGIKRVKKKPDMNISKGKLKSVATPKNFSFLNMSVQKQTLRANNRALAQNLSKARQDIRQLNTEIQSLRSQNQEQRVELNRLKRLVGAKDEEIHLEVQRRIQDEMQGMRHLLEELTQSMMQSSTYITKMNDKCLAYCSRRSTDSSRSVSLGSNQGNQSLNRLNSRVAFKDLGGKDDLMAKYLSKADEFTAPPGSRIFTDDGNAADMSIIAEQSILDNTEEIFTAYPLTSVDETISEVSPVDNVALTKPLSKLPQRVLKYSDTAKSNTKTNSSELTSVSSEKSTESDSDSSRKEKSGKEFVKSRSKTSKTKELQSGKCKDTEKIHNVSSSKPKEVVADQSKVVKNKENKIERENKNETIEIDLDEDISAFGFGGSFATNLVSGSPIAAEKRRETFVMSEPQEISEIETNKVEKKRETFVKPKEIEIGENKTSGKGEQRKQRETFVLPKAPLQVSSKGKKDNTKIVDTKISKNPTENRKKKELRGKIFVKSKEKRRETYATDNPFVPKKAQVQRSPVKLLDEENTGYDRISDPFKPTKTLVRSPVRITVQNASPEKKVDSLAFLAKFRESLESRPVESSPLPDPEIPDEPTTYFNSEMEFTSVIDSTRLLQSLSRSQKNSPVVPMEEVAETNHAINSKRNPKLNEDLKSKDSGKNKSVEKPDVQQEVGEAAAVEVRTKKPGVFTFSVSRKEADGTRKAVPEKVSKARSKKKRPETPEKEERKTGLDRDMFNFGDRTPTMPLDRLAKAKSVYDMSMNESVAAPLVSLNNFSDKEQLKLTESKSQDQIYYMPLKDSSEDKPVRKHSRSQSRSRSKSRKTDDDDDEDWVPGHNSRARSQSRGRKTNDEETTKRRGRSQSRKRVTKDNETDEKENPSDETSRARSRSGNNKVESQISERRCRSRSRARVIKDDEDTENTEKEAFSDSEENSVSGKTDHKEIISNRLGRSKTKKDRGDLDDEVDLGERRGRSRSRARLKVDFSDSEENSISGKTDHKEISSNRLGRSKTKKDRGVLDDEVDSGERRGRSRSRARPKVDDSKVSTEVSENNADAVNTENTLGVPRRSARSKSQARKPVLDDEEEDFDSSPQIQRKSTSRAPRRSARSKSRARKPLLDDEEDFDSSPNRKSRSKSVQRRKTCEISIEDENESKTDNQETENVLESKINNTNKEPEMTSKGSIKRIIPVITVPDSDDSDSKEIEDNEKSKKVSNNVVNASQQKIVIEESESDSEISKKLERSKRKSRRCIKSAKYDENEFEDDVETSTNENKSEHSVSDNTELDTNGALCVPMADIKNNDLGRNFAFINKRRGKSLRIPDDEDDNLDKEYVKENIKESKNLDTWNEILRNSDSEEESPKIRKKTEDRKTTKSVKKSAKKRKPDTDSKSGKSRQNIAEKLVKDENTECIDDTAKSSVTPAPVPSVSKKSAKTSRTGKSTRKVKAENHPDQTPVTKEEKTANKIADKPNSLAMLKKRLTMLGTKHSQQEDKANDDHNPRKRSSREEIDQQPTDSCDSPDSKRSRRNKNPVSYVTLPLNVKLRRGDQMFQETAMSKVKAEQSRLAIAKKFNVPKISRDDKENIVQT